MASYGTLNIVMKNTVHKGLFFEEKLEKIKADGKEKLHIISDFDRTLTPHQVDGVKSSTSFAQFRNGGYLGEEYAQKAHAMYDMYHPIEVDVTVPEEVRVMEMKKWWGEHMELLVSSGVTREIVEDIVSRGSIRLREGGEDFLTLCASANVPLLIFSAGLGDLITHLLQVKKVLTPNMHVVSNFFDFNDEGRAVGVIGDTISSVNKHESEIVKSAYAEGLRVRTNVIVLGDSLDDLRVTEGLSHETILSIGFLNENVDQSRAIFLEKFDLVIEGDGSLEEVIHIVNQIVAA